MRLFIKQNQIMVCNGMTWFNSDNSVKIAKEHIMTPDDIYHPVTNLYLSDCYIGMGMDDTVRTKDFIGVPVESFSIENDYAVLFY